MGKANWNSRTKRDLIIEVWEDLDCESVGALELEHIQRALREKFGTDALASPASIARVVADEGAVLRHPEVFEWDVKWREENLKQGAFANVLDFSDLPSAFASVLKLEETRLHHRKEKGATSLTELRGAVVAARKDLLLRARSKIIDGDSRAQLKEVSEWLTVWLQSPELFSDWLDLRRRSPEFRKKFPEELAR
jgi:hypothetical protein